MNATRRATYRPERGLIRVVIVKEEHGREYFFCTDPNATPRQIEFSAPPARIGCSSPRWTVKGKSPTVIFRSWS